MDYLNNKLPEYNKKRLNKAEEVYQFLMEGITSGVWVPGDRINDKEVSEHLGINRLSVREGLSRLIQDDIVEQIQWKGYYIRNITPEEVQAFVDVRIVLEQLTIKYIVKRKLGTDDPLFVELESVIEESALKLESKDHTAYMKIDFSFHEILYKISGNPWINKIIGSSLLIINILRNISMGENDIEFEKAAIQSMKDHKDILEALRNSDEDLAHSLMEQHLANRFIENIVEKL